MFRAQWMFELAPGVGTSSLETRPCRTARGSQLKAAADTKGKQELAKEEELSIKDIIILSSSSDVYMTCSFSSYGRS